MGDAFYEAIGVDVKSSEWKTLLKEAEGMKYDKDAIMGALVNITNDFSVDRDLALILSRKMIVHFSALHTLNKSKSRKVNNEFEETLLFYHNVFESYK